MQLTGEFKRMNLIPVKKAVLDLRKGLILRTYYVNPQKFLEKIIQQKLRKSQIYIGKLDKDIQTALKTKNILSLKDRFDGDLSWKAILNRNIEITQSILSPKTTIQFFGTSLLNFITTLDTNYITKAKRQVKNLQLRYTTTITEKVSKLKRVKVKVKEKEQRLSDDDLFIDNIKYDGAKITRKVELVETKDPKLAGLRISKLINMLNPSTPKLIKIFDSVMNTKQFIDKNDIGKNIMFLPYHVRKEPEFFKSFLSNMIIECERKLYEGSENVNPEILIYYYNLLLQIDKEMFNTLTLNFNRTEIRDFTKEKDTFANLYTKYTSTPFLPSLLLFYPDIKQIINYLLTHNNDMNIYEKVGLFSYLSARISPVLLERIYQSVFKDVSIEGVVDDWIKYTTHLTNTLSIHDILYQVVFASVLRVPYFPFDVLEDIEPNNPFILTPITKISKISKFINMEIIDFLKGRHVKERIECYVPIRNIPPTLNNIALKLLPLQIGVLDMERYGSGDIDFVKVNVNEYIKVGDDCILFTPFNITN